MAMLVFRLFGESTKYKKSKGVSRAFSGGLENHDQQLVDDFICQFEEVRAIDAHTGDTMFDGELVASSVFSYDDGETKVVTTKGPKYIAVTVPF